MKTKTTNLKKRKPIKYSSTKMEIRRETVLENVRNIISEKGLSGVTVKLVAEMSSVTPQTLFNIYGSKDNLVISAVMDAFSHSMDGRTSKKPESIDDILSYIEWTVDQIIILDNYIDVITSSFFSGKKNNLIKDILISESEYPYVYYIKNKHNNGFTVRDIDIDELGNIICNTIFSTMMEWSVYRYVKPVLEYKIKLGVISTISSILLGDERERADREIVRLMSESKPRIDHICT